MEQTLAREVTDEEISEWTDIPLTKVQSVLRSGASINSPKRLDAPLADGSDETVSDRFDVKSISDEFPQVGETPVSPIESQERIATGVTPRPCGQIC